MCRGARPRSVSRLATIDSPSATPERLAEALPDEGAPPPCSLCLAYQAYGIVANESFYDMRDVVSTCWLANDAENFFAPPVTPKLTIAVELNARVSASS
jgi:hypothetical protein